MLRSNLLLLPLLACGLFSITAAAYDHGAGNESNDLIEAYESSFVGQTVNDHHWDDSFLDFTLSVKYHFPKEWFWQDENKRSFYFAFNGRFAQYINTRDSSPVEGKRFNPKIFYRWNLGQPSAKDEARSSSDYIDFGYNHESNGQSINTQQEYDADVLSPGDRGPSTDRISRGWDYFEVAWKHRLQDGNADLFVALKAFLHKGLLQGVNEEYASWEMDPEGKTRKSVDGINVVYEYRGSGEWWIFSEPSLTAHYMTGYDPLFRYHTFRADIGLHTYKLPIVLWAQRGYNREISTYFQKGTTFGLGFRFGGTQNR